MEGELQRIFSRNVCALREARGLTQEAMAESIGFTRTYIGVIESGKRNFSLRTIERISEAIGVDPFALLVPPSEAKVATLRAAASGVDPDGPPRRPP